MKPMRTALTCLGVLALLVLATTPARAGDADCVSVSSCNFGLLQASQTGTLSAGSGGHSATYMDSVYRSGSVYTYVFTITNNNAHALDFANTFTNPGGGGFGDNFNCGNGSCLNYGVVTTLTTSGKNDTGFAFNSLSLQVGFTPLLSGQSFTFYVQGGPFTTGQLYAGNSGATSPSASLDPLSEPGVLTLLGSLLLVLMLGTPFASRFRQCTA